MLPPMKPKIESLWDEELIQNENNKYGEEFKVEEEEDFNKVDTKTLESELKNKNLS